MAGTHSSITLPHLLTTHLGPLPLWAWLAIYLAILVIGCIEFLRVGADKVWFHVAFPKSSGKPCGKSKSKSKSSGKPCGKSKSKSSGLGKPCTSSGKLPCGKTCGETGLHAATEEDRQEYYKGEYKKRRRRTLVAVLGWTVLFVHFWWLVWIYEIGKRVVRGMERVVVGVVMVKHMEELEMEVESWRRELELELEGRKETERVGADGQAVVVRDTQDARDGQDGQNGQDAAQDAQDAQNAQAEVRAPVTVDSSYLSRPSTTASGSPPPPPPYEYTWAAHC